MIFLTSTTWSNRTCCFEYPNVASSHENVNDNLSMLILRYQSTSNTMQFFKTVQVSFKVILNTKAVCDTLKSTIDNN